MSWGGASRRPIVQMGDLTGRSREESAIRRPDGGVRRMSGII
jgi:hypothetical protein